MIKKKKKTPAKKASVNDAIKAAAVVTQVIAHFGAGCGAPNGQIFATPRAMALFSAFLMKSTLRNFNKLRWDKDAATRDAVCQVAFLHGQLARTAAGTGTLTWSIIEGTLKQVKKQQCPGSAGGGLVCES